ncbi:Cytochrome b [Enhydrobacter aerosaccus]|uniref:Cytochrome b n=1 Tax=Enhydrobacter aerosaccus TaxID=225324 RepID=A0A1T4MND9_9HYPH|nr:cytochrome b/b6 domain-containing protein [Enhydrobacter aerosaccus]SJZ68336.1 Cytochrome b [Enhydrobacter aerosaccus]
MAAVKSTKGHLALVKAWHALLAGAFLIAYVTADEDTYAMHQFAGYTVLTAIALRLLFGLVAPAASPLRLPRPSWRAARNWLATRKGRHPLFAWFAASLLAVVGLVSLSGALADGATWLEDPHEVIAEASLWLIAAHIAFVTYMYAGRQWLARIGTRLSAAPKETTR